MKSVREFLRNCSRFLFILLCFFLFSVSAFARVDPYSPVSFSDCGTEGLYCHTTQTDVTSIELDDEILYESSVWPDSLFAFSGTFWDDNSSNPYLMDFNFSSSVSEYITKAEFIFDGAFNPTMCDTFSECRFKFLSLADGLSNVEKIYEQPNLDITEKLYKELPQNQLDFLNEPLTIRLLAYGTPPLGHAGVQSLIDQVRLDVYIDDILPTVDGVTWKKNGSMISQAGTAADPAHVSDLSSMTFDLELSDTGDAISGLDKEVFVIYQENPANPGTPYWTGSGGTAYCSWGGVDNSEALNGEASQTISSIELSRCSDEVLPAGRYVVANHLYDIAGNLRGGTLLTFVFDSTSPSQPIITAPENNLLTNVNHISVIWTGGDDQGSKASGVEGYYLRYVFTPADGGSDISWTSGLRPGNPKIHSGSYGHGEGIYVIYVKTIDKAGNESPESEPLTVTYDATPPVVTLNSPSAGYVNGQVVINGSASDPNLNYYRVIIHDDTSQRVANPGRQFVTSDITDEDLYIWDSTQVDDGNYKIILIVEDTLPNRTTLTRDIIVDNTPPSQPTGLQIIDHQGIFLGCGGFTNDRHITIDWNDNSEPDLDYYLFDLKDKDGHKQLTDSIYPAQIRDEDGLYKYKIRAVDKAGNISLASNWCQVILDREMPSIPGIPYTLPNPTNSTLQNWFWDGSTDIGDSGVKGYYQNIYDILGGTNTGWSWLGNVSGSSTNLDEGMWQLKVKAEDNAGNEGDESESLELVVDTTSPPTPTELKFLDADHSTVRQCGDVIFRQISIPVWDEYLGSDFSHYEYSSFHPSGAQGLNEEPLYTATLENSWLAPADGAYGFAVRTVDLAGNKSAWALSGETLEGSCQIIYDSVPPVVTVDSLVINDTTPALSGTVSDEHQIDSIIVTVGGQSSDLAIIHADGTWTLADDVLSPLADGLYDVVAEATDEAGNVGTDATSDELRIDSVAPTAVFTHYIDEVEFLGEIAYVNDINRLTFTGNYTDDVPSSGLKQDSFVIFDAQEDGSFAFSNHGAKAYCSWRSGANTIPLSGLTDTLTAIPFAYCENPLGEGEYYMTHQVYDSAIRKDIPSITQFRDVLGLHFVIDTTTPTVDITSPVDGDVISGTTTVTVDAADLTSEVERVELSYRAVGDGTWTSLASLITSPYTYDWNTTGLPLGDYELQAEAFDLAGNSEVDQIGIGVAAVISGQFGSTPAYGEIFVSWFTDRPTNARVVYDTVSHPVEDMSHLNYGYAYTSSIFDLAKTTYHETILTGLNDQTIYYYRFISAGSPTAIGGEMNNRTFSVAGPGSPPSSGPSGDGTPSPLIAYVSPSVMGVYTTPASVLPEEGEVLGEETTPTPEPEKSPPAITTPTPEVLGAITSVSPLYFLGGGLLISLILMVLLFRRK